MEKKPDNFIWTSNFAYAVGLIASDGHLYKDGRHIAMTSKDIELINNFATALSLNNKISAMGSGRENHKPYFRIVFSHRKLHQYLETIGITPAKSHTISKVKVPEKYFADFLRGLFDGDGSFYSYYDKRWKNSLVYQIAFYSASYQFISWLKFELSKKYGTKGFIRKGDGVWALRFVKQDTRKLQQVMYYNANVLLLKRKYIKIYNTIYLHAPVAQWFRADA